MNQQLITPTPASHLRETLRRQAYELPIPLLVL